MDAYKEVMREYHRLYKRKMKANFTPEEKELFDKKRKSYMKKYYQKNRENLINNRRKYHEDNKNIINDKRRNKKLWENIGLLLFIFYINRLMGIK
jgi:hypothetical protein